MFDRPLQIQLCAAAWLAKIHPITLDTPCEQAGVQALTIIA